jgi:hypothetical protein
LPCHSPVAERTDRPAVHRIVYRSTEGDIRMHKTTLSAAAFAIATLLAAPAYADCAKDAMMTKEMAMKVTDAKKKEMALQHVTMAEDKAKGKMENECMAEVMKAKDAMK